MRRLPNELGFSLVELMVALVIASLLLGGLVTTFTNANTNYGELTKASRQIENGRYAISTLETDLRHAGFWGEYTGTLAGGAGSTPPTTNPQPCSDTPDQIKVNLIVPVYGYSGNGVAPIPCLPNYKAGTDVLVVRRTSTDSYSDKSLLTATGIYFQGSQDPPSGKGPYLNYGNAAAFDGTDVQGTVPIHPFIQHIYYIASCRNCPGDTIPTLIRRDYAGPNNFATVPIAEGIEQMHIRYGIDATGVNAPSTYKVASAMLLDPDWDSVVAVEINLLARNSEETRNYSDTKTYVLGDWTIQPSKDAFRRHAFTQVVKLINPSSRREK